MTGPFIFILGLVAGGWLFGPLCFVLGSIFGHDAGARDVVRLLVEVDEAHGDVPSMPWEDRS
jgi:hypothetical protein